MSQVQRVECPICNPGSCGTNGVRRPISLTNQELAEFIQHVVITHTSLADVGQTADTALTLANKLAKAQ